MAVWSASVMWKRKDPQRFASQTPFPWMLGQPVYPKRIDTILERKQKGVRAMLPATAPAERVLSSYGSSMRRPRSTAHLKFQQISRQASLTATDAPTVFIPPQRGKRGGSRGPARFVHIGRPGVEHGYLENQRQLPRPSGKERARQRRPEVLTVLSCQTWFRRSSDAPPVLLSSPQSRSVWSLWILEPGQHSVRPFETAPKPLRPQA